VLRRELALLKHKTIQEQAISDRVVLLSGLFLGIDVCDGIYDGTREYHRENWTPGVYPEPEEAAATLSKKLQGHDPHGVSEFFSDLLKNNEFARALDRTIPDYVAGKFLEADARHRWSEQNPILPIVHLVRMAILYNLTGRPTPLGDLWKTLTAKVFRGDRSAGTRQTFEAVMRIYYENPDAFSPETVVNGPPPAIGNKPSASILEPVAKRSWGAGSLHYMLYTIAAAPLWETALFFTPHGIPGILWATLGFAFAHTIVAWIVRIRDLGWSGSFNRADLKQDGHDFLRNLGLSLLFLSPSLLTHSLGFFGAVELSIVLHAAYNAVVLMGLLPDRVQAILAPGSVFDRLAVKDRPEPVDESTRLGAIALRQWLVTYPPEFRMLLEKTMQAMVDRSAGDEMALEGISPKHLQNRKFYRGSISDSELETFVTLLTDNQKLQSSILDPRVAHPDVPLLGEISLALESAVERMSDARAVSYAQKANLSALYAEIYLAFAEKLPTLKSQLTSRSLSEIQVIDEPPATSEVIEALGRAMDPSSDGPWTVVFFDLDDLGTYIKAWPDVMVDHYVSLFDEHLRKTHPEARVGRVGGDEFFMVIPQDGPEVMALLAEQQNSFRNINPYQRYRPITFSAGVVTKDQLLKYGRGFKETYDPTARFQIAREMASQPLKRVKDELGKATISLYTPPTWKEWWDDIRDRLWKRRVVKPLHPETYKSPRFKPLLVDLDVHAPIPPSVRVGRPGSVIRRFEKPEDFDNRVEALGNRAHLLLKIEHTYASRDLNEVYEKMNAAGSRVYGERMGGKAWNTLNISGQIFNEIILAQRTVEYDALADAFANLPPQWQGELWFVRGPPDKISIAILAADDGNQFEQENERLRNEAMAFEGLFTRVLDNAEREMNGDAWYSPIFNEARGTNVQLNAVVKVVGRSYREAADQMKRMRKVLLHETGSELSSHPKPRRRLVMLGHNQTLDPEDYQTSMDIRRTEKVAADKELLIDRTAPKKGETTPAMVNQAIRELHRLPLPVKEMIRVIKLIKRTSPQLAALIKAQGYQVILCGDQTTKELSPGVTLYAGMQQKTIYLAMGEYLQLKNIGDAFDQGLLYLAGRIGRVVQDIRIRETVVVSSLSGSFAHNQGVQREQSITGRPGVSGKAILIDNKDKKIPSPLPRFTKSAGSQLLDRQG